MQNYITAKIHRGEVTALILLDLLAALDIIYFNTLLNRLSSWHGISGSAVHVDKVLIFKVFLLTRLLSHTASYTVQALGLGCILQRILTLILSQLSLISITKVRIDPNFCNGNKRTLR